MRGINFVAHLFSVICTNAIGLSKPFRNNIHSDILLFLWLAGRSSCYHIAQDALENTDAVTVNCG